LRATLLEPVLRMHDMVVVGWRDRASERSRNSVPSQERDSDILLGKETNIRGFRDNPPPFLHLPTYCSCGMSETCADAERAMSRMAQEVFTIHPDTSESDTVEIEPGQRYHVLSWLNVGAPMAAHTAQIALTRMHTHDSKRTTDRQGNPPPTDRQGNQQRPPSRRSITPLLAATTAGTAG